MIFEVLRTKRALTFGLDFFKDFSIGFRFGMNRIDNFFGGHDLEYSMMNVFIIAAISADGLIAKDSDEKSTAWTSKADKKFFSERTKKAGVVVMGRKTFDTIGKPLSERLNIVYSRQPSQPSQSLRFTNKSPVGLIKELEKEGYEEVAICGGASIYTMFMKAGIVNKIYLTVESVMFGMGVRLFNQEIKAKLKLERVKKLSTKTVLLEYSS
jgi:dihydrofolate reductase